MSDDFKVDFIGIGAPRCGTTWISRCLAEHPQICFSQPKETHFFNKDHNYNRGIEYYKTFFKDYKEGQIRGEFSPFYYLSEEAAKRIKKHNRDVKLIVCLRNPIDRSFSNYKYRKIKIREKADNFNEAFSTDTRYLDNSLYFKHVHNFLVEYLPRNYLIVIYEKIKSNPEESFKAIFHYLGVKESFVPNNITNKINTSDRIYINKLPIIINNGIKNIKRKKIGNIFIRILNFFKINLLYRLIIKSNVNNSDIKTEIIDKNKYYKFFKDDIINLEKEYKINLKIWKL